MKNYKTSAWSRKVTRQQAELKKKLWPRLPPGFHQKTERHYDHILPEGYEKLAFYPPIADAVFEYASERNLKIHDEIRNLKSSQACCFNFLFPLKLDLEAAALALRHFHPTLESVKDLDFEYTGPSELTDWLGEPEYGRPGYKRTSIDCAVFWTSNDGNPHVTLIEWKYTEVAFGTCSSQKTSCRKDDYQKNCPLVHGSIERPRRYFECLEEAEINLSKIPSVGCPFRGAIYQLMRQSLVAFWVKENIGLEPHLVSLNFTENTSTESIEAEYYNSAMTSLLELWNLAVPADLSFQSWAVESLLDVVREDSRDWLQEHYFPAFQANE
ncbi:hypothetical protein ACFL07_05860 [Pseudomonadota bacterium]